MRRRCDIIWSLLLLDRMFLGCTNPHATLPPLAFGEAFVHSRSDKNGAGADIQNPYNLHSHFDTGQGIDLADIVSINIDLLQIWEDVIADSSQALPLHDKPFWMGDSRRGRIISALLEFETSQSNRYGVDA